MSLRKTCVVVASLTLCLLVLLIGGLDGRAAQAVVLTGQCGDSFSAVHDPVNPLMLPKPPGADPLRGARLFVDGPAHGAAAGAIASLLGRDPHQYADNVSWNAFKATIPSPPSRDVQLLEKIAREPESNRISNYSEGGTPAGVYDQTQKIICRHLTADPGSIPVLTTYFLHPSFGGSATPAQIRAGNPAFRARVDAMAAATGNRPVVFLLEIDGLGSSKGFERAGSLGLWEADLRYEALKIGSLPHTVVYLEGGYSDSNSPGYTARALNRSGVRRIQGFYTNDTHSNWTIDEIRWGRKVSRMTGGAHFIVNTATNGRGPLRPRLRDRVRLGNEVLCNPPGRGMGHTPTTRTRFALVDAFLWTGPPGNSSGPCNGGTAPGTFWPARAIYLAARASNQLGPRRR